MAKHNLKKELIDFKLKSDDDDYENSNFLCSFIFNYSFLVIYLRTIEIFKRKILSFFFQFHKFSKNNHLIIIIIILLRFFVTF